MSSTVTLILRTMKAHMGWEDAKDDYVVLDGERSGGRIYKDHSEAKLGLVGEHLTVSMSSAPQRVVHISEGSQAAIQSALSRTEGSESETLFR
jgi:hypothetical protein